MGAMPDKQLITCYTLVLSSHIVLHVLLLLTCCPSRLVSSKPGAVVKTLEKFKNSTERTVILDIELIKTQRSNLRVKFVA
jgi:hypothetical protein